MQNQQLANQLSELIAMLPMAVNDYQNEVDEGLSDEMVAKDLNEAINHVALALATLGVIDPAIDRGLIND